MMPGDKFDAAADGMTATPITRAAAQATVWGKQANEARISEVPFSSGQSCRQPPPTPLVRAISVPNSTEFQNIFLAGKIEPHFPDTSHPEKP
jgi:hypothetical protein